MSSLPAITVGLPVFNGASYLSEAVDSILGQTYSEIELLIADNASTDGTLEMCHEFARRDDRVRVLSSMINRGLAWNWNRLVVEARAPNFSLGLSRRLAPPGSPDPLLFASSSSSP